MAPALNTFPLNDPQRLRHALLSVASGQSPEAIIDLVVALLTQLSGENKRLQLRLQKALRSLHGRKSEKLTPEQLDLFRKLLTEVQQGMDDENAEAEPPPSPRGPKRAKPHGRRPFPPHLPRVENIILVPETERVCNACGTEKVCIGHETSERLDYVPAVLRVIQDKREKLACRPCQGSVSVAPTAPKVVEGGMAAEGLLAHVVVSKYIDGLTLTRLAKIYQRGGVALAESTLGDFVRAVAHHLKRLAQTIEADVLKAYIINTDDTGLRVLDQDHPKGTKRGHIWTFVAAGQGVVYRYTPDWRGEHPCAVLQGFAGIIQSDGYAGINPLFKNADGARRAGCMMHCRRYFYDAHKTGDMRAGVALALIADIYAIERTAKERALSHQERLRLRQEQSLPLMERLRKWIDAIEGQAPPKTDLGKAFTYAKNQWASLLVPFFDGRCEIDNGEAERRLKLLATGRKAWLFAGSDAGGERAATILTVLGTALMHGLDPLAYLTDILGQIAAGLAGSRIAELLPAAWAEKQGKQAHTQQAPIPRLVG